MIDKILNIDKIDNRHEIPWDLLMLADSSRCQINKYLNSGTCYIAKLNSEIIGVIILNETNSNTIEIKNIAIKKSFQGKGIGKKLLRFTANTCRQMNFHKMIIGTGNSSIGQLTLYQKEGFEISHIDKHFFTRNYSKSIFENDIQCKHMIMLEKKLK